MGGLSSQTLALLLVLSPGFLFLVGFYFAPQRYPTKISIQRGIVADTATYVVASAMINVIIGLPFLLIVNLHIDCNIIYSFAQDVRFLHADESLKRCSFNQDAYTIIGYAVVIWLMAVVSGIGAAKLIELRPSLFSAVYGPYYGLVESRQPYVIADVLTKVEHEGKILAYEGNLIELSLLGTREINFVCLEGASKLFLSLSGDLPTTTSRKDFVSIDKNTRPISRITIPGSEISNLVTRTRRDIDVEELDDTTSLSTRRRVIQFFLPSAPSQ